MDLQPCSSKGCLPSCGYHKVKRAREMNSLERLRDVHLGDCASFCVKAVRMHSIHGLLPGCLREQLQVTEEKQALT